MQGRAKQQAGRPHGPQGVQQQPLPNKETDNNPKPSQRAIMALFHLLDRGCRNGAKPGDSPLSIGRQTWPNRENRYRRQILPKRLLAVLAQFGRAKLLLSRTSSIATLELMPPLRPTLRDRQRLRPML